MYFQLGVLTYHIRPTRNVRRAVFIAFQRFHASLFGSIGLLTIGTAFGSLGRIDPAWTALIIGIGVFAVIIEGWTSISVSLRAIARLFRWGDAAADIDDDPSTVSGMKIPALLRPDTN